MPIEIAIPFNITANGAVASTEDPDTQIHQHVASLLATYPRTRVMLPDYGLQMADLIFQDADEATMTMIKQQVEQQFDRYEPGVLVTRVDARFDEEQTMLGVDVAYSRRESADLLQSASRSTNTAVVHVGGKISEVIRG